MPLNSFSVGRDISLDIVGPNGPLRFSLITKFMAKPDITSQKIKGLDGITRHVRFPDGWMGDFEIDRQNSEIDDYWAQLETNYYAGLNEQPVTITETIVEVSGAVSQFRYIGVILKVEDSGSWQGDATVKQKLSFMAERRVKVS